MKNWRDEYQKWIEDKQGEAVSAYDAFYAGFQAANKQIVFGPVEEIKHVWIDGVEYVEKR